MSISYPKFLAVLTTLVFLSPTQGGSTETHTHSKDVAQGGPESISPSRYQSFSAEGGMVVSDDRIASEWGAEVLRRGGNAVDAAVATAFVLSVTRPHYASLGGGGFLVFCPRGIPEKIEAQGMPACQTLDFREQAPSRISSQLFMRNGKIEPKLAQNGPLAIGVPGLPAGLLFALEKWGTLPRAQLLTRPIQLALRGFRFTTYAEVATAIRWPHMNDAARLAFGCRKPREGWVPCHVGANLIQRDLANVLTAISRQGHNGFYRGMIAQKIADGIQKAGGVLSKEDLASYQVIPRSPVLSRFGAMEVVAMPPPSSGGIILNQLLEYASLAHQAGAFDQGFGSTNAVHALATAMSLAYSDRAKKLGDPEHIQVPIPELISPSYLKQKWTAFDPDHAPEPPQVKELKKREPRETTHFSVIDRTGNAVAITVTVNDNFGSAFVPPGTGIVMNNQMDDFSLAPGVPNMFGLVGGEVNAIAPRKRPLSSMTPAILRDRNGQVRLVIGAAGGPRIATAVFQSIWNHYHFGMSLIDAVLAPRIHQQWSPGELFLERLGYPYEVRKSLETKGYVLKEVGSLGKIHALEKRPDGTVVGVADARGEGAAVGQ